MFLNSVLDQSQHFVNLAKLVRQQCVNQYKLFDIQDFLYGNVHARPSPNHRLHASSKIPHKLSFDYISKLYFIYTSYASFSTLHSSGITIVKSILIDDLLLIKCINTNKHCSYLFQVNIKKKTRTKVIKETLLYKYESSKLHVDQSYSILQDQRYFFTVMIDREGKGGNFLGNGVSGEVPKFMRGILAKIFWVTFVGIVI